MSEKIEPVAWRYRDPNDTIPEEAAWMFTERERRGGEPLYSQAAIEALQAEMDAIEEDRSISSKWCGVWRGRAEAAEAELSTLREKVEIAATAAARVCYETRHVTLGDKVYAAIHAAIGKTVNSSDVRAHLRDNIAELSERMERAERLIEANQLDDAIDCLRLSRAALTNTDSEVK